MHQETMLKAALAEARDEYRRSNPLSAAAHQEATKSLPGGNTRSVIHATPFPLTFKHGKDADLTDLDGHGYIDFLSEYTAGLFGHSDARISSAINEALSTGWNMGGPNQYERLLAAAVCDRMAPAVEKVRFTNSGTEANMYALAAATAFNDAQKIVTFRNGYHGGSIGFSLPNDPMRLPHQWIVAPYDDIDGTRAAVENGLEKHERLAAILVEPMQGNAGAASPSVEFLQFLRGLADEKGALLIFDEVMTSRLARGGLGQSLGVRPDLITMGKWIGGGMTIGAFGGRADVMEQFNPDNPSALRHAGTFNNNIVTMAAGVAGMGIYDDQAMQQLNKKGEALKQGAATILTAAGLQNPPETQHSDATHIWVSGRGSILALRTAGTSAEDITAMLWHHMLKNGIYIARRGFISLNLMLTDRHVERFLEVLKSFLHTYFGAPGVDVEVNDGAERVPGTFVPPVPLEV